MFWVYLATAVVGMPLMSALQAALTIPFVALVFKKKDQDFLWHELENVKEDMDIIDADHRARRAAFAARPSYWIFVLYMSFVVASGMEELLKYIMVRFGKRHRSIDNLEYLMYGIVAGLSFATLENLGFLIRACQAETGGRLLLTLVERIALGVPIHTICATLTAAGLAIQDFNISKLGFMGVIGPSIFFHGMFDFILFGYCAWSGNVGWIHPEDLGSIVVLFVCAIVIITAAAFSLRSRIVILSLM